MINMKLYNIKKNVHVIEFIRFCIVGVLCTAIDACLFYLIKLVFCYQIALATAYILSLVVNYYLTTYWTFKVKPSKKNFTGIVGVHLFNLFIVRMGLMWFFVSYYQISENIAYIPTLILSVMVTFFLIKVVVKK